MGYIAPAWLVNNVAAGVDQWNITFSDFIGLLYVRLPKGKAWPDCHPC